MWKIGAQDPDPTGAADETLQVVAVDGDEALLKAKNAAIGQEVFDEQGVSLGFVTDTVPVGLSRTTQIDVT